MKDLSISTLFKIKRKAQKQLITKIVFNLNFYQPKLFEQFDGDFNYLTRGDLIKISTNDIPILVEKGLITQVKQTVYPLDFEPELSKHGFECRFLPEDIQLLLSKYNKSDSDGQSKLREQVRTALERLLFNHFHLQAVALDAIYRNTSEDSTNTFKAVPLVHIDFPATNPQRTLDSFQKEWAPKVYKKIDPSKYDANQIELMVNIWMPLDTITASPLVLCSNENIETS